MIEAPEEMRLQVMRMLAAVRAEFAPDPRSTVFEVELRMEGETMVLAGEISDPAAVEELGRRVAMLDGSLAIRDAVARLPAAGVDEASHALITASVAPMLIEPFIRSLLISQVVLGETVQVLRRRGRWLHCRSRDGYLGWIHRGYLVAAGESEARRWEIGVGGEASVSLGAEFRAPGGEVRIWLPVGARVIRQADGLLRLPDGRVGEGVGEAIPLATCRARFPARGDAVVVSALLWRGAPYLWGGVTSAGVDCSGLVQTTMRLHGVELPRDSDLQALRGVPADPGPDFARVRSGDLLFFAEEPGRITHVALSTGGSRIVHSSLGNGGVATNDLCGELPYERELRRLFVAVRRVLS